MKKSYLYDTLFILVLAGLLALIEYMGYQKQVSQFTLLIALAAYFIGKRIARSENKTRQD